MAHRTDKSPKYVREQISRRASRLGVTAEAAQVIWARELGIGTAAVLRRLEPHVQQQVRAAYLSVDSITGGRSPARAEPPKAPVPGDPVLVAAEYLLTDARLKSRCIDLLRRKKHLDRVVREATTVLEDRIRQLADITAPLKPEELINTALNPDPNRAVLVFGSDPSEQQGFHSVCRGIVLAFRHKVHHRLSDEVTRHDALKFCAFVDMLLGLLATTKKRT